jgi:membrane protein YdbS with pleckstrin-like domain
MVKSSSNGIGLGTVLFIVFLILKLTGNIDWSWWWVTSPLWIPLAFIVIALFIIGVFVVIAKRNRL